MRVRFLSVALVVVLLISGCGTSRAEQLEDAFRECIEAGGGTAGEFEAALFDDLLVAFVGDVSAPDEVWERCFEQAQQM